MGKQQHLSVRDVEKINKYYGCSGEGIYKHYELTNDIRHQMSFTTLIIKLKIIADYTTTSTASTSTTAEESETKTTTNYEGKDSDEITTESQSETTTSDDSGEKKTSTNPDDIYVEFRVKAEQD